MKNLKLTIFSILIITLCSCNNNDDILETHEKLTFSYLSDSNYSSIIANSKLNQETNIENLNINYKEYTVLNEELNRTLINSEMSDIKIDALVSFGTESLNNAGVGIYYYSKKEESLYFTLFKYENGNQTQMDDYPVIVNDISLKDIKYIHASFFKRKNVSLFVPENLKPRNLKNDYNDLKLRNRLEKIKEERHRIGSMSLNELKRVDELTTVDDVAACGWTNKCLTTAGTACSIYSGCSEPSCGANRLQDKIVTEKYDNYIFYITKVILEDKYYTFRDSFLAKSTLGKEYTSKYYSITDHFMNATNYEINMDILKALPEINQAIDNISNSTYKGTIMSNELKNKIYNILNKLKVTSNSSTFRNVIDEFKTDLGNFSNKNLTQVNDEIQHSFDKEIP